MKYRECTSCDSVRLGLFRGAVPNEDAVARLAQDHQQPSEGRVRSEPKWCLHPVLRDIVIVGADDQQSIQSDSGKDLLQMYINIFKLPNLHQIDPLFGDVILDTLLKLLRVLDSLD